MAGMDMQVIDRTAMAGTGTMDMQATAMPERPTMVGEVTPMRIIAGFTTGIMPGITRLGAIITLTITIIGATTTLGVITTDGDGVDGIGTVAGSSARVMSVAVMSLRT
jgi:hypothetical protein